ncbi:hypothetical protein FO519_004091 [Halicephalobus sp. NKZ332]|nr:hypothetical protein FO519_004091 [Halicephalobus sp. NKZ332]
MFPTYDHNTPGVNSNLPFIPAPDYSKTVKQQYPPKRPGLPMQKKESWEKVSPNNQLTIFTDFNNIDHVVDLKDGRIFPSPEKSRGMHGDNQLQNPTLSPEQKKEETQKRVLKMLQTQGVPVFPGLAPKGNFLNSRNPGGPSVPNFSGGLEQSHLGPTRAYIKHLENHRKFDTLNSFKDLEKCPICRQMLGEIELLAEKNKKTKNDWVSQGEKQLTIKYGETLKVSKMGHEWTYCRNNRGDSGWVPSNQLYLMPGGYF